MKTFAKEMWHLLVFAAALIAFNAGLTILFDSWSEWFTGELSLKTALFLTVVQVGLGLLALKTFEWLHKHVAETRGMKYFKDALEKHADALRTEQKKVEDKLIEYAAANESLAADNETLKTANNNLFSSLERSNANFNELSRRHDALKAAHVVPENQHIDDWALDRFIIQLRSKLRKKREEGHAGWNDCQLAVLHDLLVEEVESLNVENMDMVDVANYAMFCWVRDAFPNECLIGYESDSRDPELDELK